MYDHIQLQPVNIMSITLSITSNHNHPSGQGSSVADALAWAMEEPGVMGPEMQQLVATAVEASRNPPNGKLSPMVHAMVRGSAVQC